MIGRSELVAAYLVGAIALGSAQQAPPDTGTTFRSGIEVVRRGPTAADFTVEENGRPQPINAFDAVDLPDLLIF